MKLRVATYNIHRAIGHDGRQDPDRIAEVLRELRADVIAMQEVAYRSGSVRDVLSYLANATQSEAVAGVTLEDERGPYGNGILSRVPITRVARLDLSVRGREPRGAIDLAVKQEGVEAQILSTHLGLRPRERRHQVTQILAKLETSTADVKILLGDFNEWLRWGRPVRRLQRWLGRSPAPATFPAHRPWLPLDRVWVSPEETLVSLRPHSSALARTASDHLPLVAEIRAEAWGKP